MRDERLNAIRGGVLQQMERAERNMKLGIFGAALIELVLVGLVLAKFDLRNSVERLIFITSVLTYSVIVLGLVALGAHVTRAVARVVTLLEPDERAG